MAQSVLKPPPLKTLRLLHSYVMGKYENITEPYDWYEMDILRKYYEGLCMQARKKGDSYHFLFARTVNYVDMLSKSGYFDESVEVELYHLLNHIDLYFNE